MTNGVRSIQLKFRIVAFRLLVIIVARLRSEECTEDVLESGTKVDSVDPVDREGDEEDTPEKADDSKLQERQEQQKNYQEKPLHPSEY